MSRNDSTAQPFLNPFSSDPNVNKKDTLLGKLVVYHANDKTTAFVAFCTRNRILVDSPRAFYKAYSKFLEDEMPGVNVYTSSSWAICQEKLQLLKSQDKAYVASRAGIWNVELVDRSPVIISFRSICRQIESYYKETNPMS